MPGENSVFSMCYGIASVTMVPLNFFNQQMKPHGKKGFVGAEIWNRIILK